VPLVNKKGIWFEDSKHILNLKSSAIPRSSRDKWAQTLQEIYDFTALLSRFLTLQFIFDFKK
jgi:hypothetical protein